MWKRGYWILLVVVLLVVTAAVAGAQGGITVLQDDYSYAFNKELVFELALQSDEPIPAKSIELLYSIGHERDVVNRRRPEYEPGKTLTLRVREELEQGQILPASTITYHWRIKDAAGNTFETQEQSFVYMDDRFDWQSKTKGLTTVYWYGRTDGERLLDVAVDALARLERTIGYQMQAPIKILLYRSNRDMLGALAPQGGRFEERIAGQTFAPDLILVLGDHSDADIFIAHEVTHLVVGAATENPFAEIPLWLNEGLAMYNEGFVSPIYTDTLRDAVRSGNLHTVRRLVGSTRASEGRSTLWYAEVLSLVDFLISEYGEDKMAELLDIFSRGAYEDDALMEVYGFDRDGLTVRWWEWLGAEVPPSLREEVTAVPKEAARPTEGAPGQAPEVQEAPTRAPAVPEPRPERQPAVPQPTGPLACCLGLLPMGLILLGALWLRNRS